MANINLLAWREWERERNRKEFLLNLGGVALIGLVIVLAWGQFLYGSVSYQKSINVYVKGRIAQIDERSKGVSNLKEARAELLERMRVIQELQGNRPVIVHIFGEMVQSLPSGAHFSTAEMADNGLSIGSMAGLNNRISALMRNLDSSEWFSDPNAPDEEEGVDPAVQAANETGQN